MLLQPINPLLLPTPFLSELAQLAVDEVDHALQLAHLPSLPLVAALG